MIAHNGFLDHAPPQVDIHTMGATSPTQCQTAWVMEVRWQPTFFGQYIFLQDSLFTSLGYQLKAATILVQYIIIEERHNINSSGLRPPTLN